MAEQEAVNFKVRGSSPRRGAKLSLASLRLVEESITTYSNLGGSSFFVSTSILVCQEVNTPGVE
jgi:hypothetical protein